MSPHQGISGPPVKPSRPAAPDRFHADRHRFQESHHRPAGAARTVAAPVSPPDRHLRHPLDSTGHRPRKVILATRPPIRCMDTPQIMHN